MRTEIMLVMDCSSSMGGAMATYNQGANQMLEEQANLEGHVVASLVTFNSDVKLHWEEVPIDEVGKLNMYATGGTRMYDGIELAVQQLESRTVDPDGAPDKRVVIIGTDGEEGGSRSKTAVDQGSLGQGWNRIRPSPVLLERIQKQIKLGTEFVFVGCTRHVAKQAQMLGIPQHNAGSFRQRHHTILELFKVLGENLYSTRAGGTMQFSEEQRARLMGG